MFSINPSKSIKNPFGYNSPASKLYHRKNLCYRPCVVQVLFYYGRCLNAFCISAFCINTPRGPWWYLVPAHTCPYNQASQCIQSVVNIWSNSTHLFHLSQLLSYSFPFFYLMTLPVLLHPLYSSSVPFLFSFSPFPQAIMTIPIDVKDITVSNLTMSDMWSTGQW